MMMCLPRLIAHASLTLWVFEKMTFTSLVLPKLVIIPNLSRVIIATILFFQVLLYSSSFVCTLKNETWGAAQEPYQLKIKQFSPDIITFRTKHKDNPFTLNCSMLPRTFLSIFHAGSRRLGSNNFWHSSYKEKMAGWAHVSRVSFRFLWLSLYWHAEC